MNLCKYIEMPQKFIEEFLYHVKVREDSMIRDFMGRRTLSVRDHVLSKSLASPCVTDLDRWKIRGKDQFFRSGSVTHGLAKLSIFYFTN